MDIEPSGALESVGTALGIPAGQVEGDLKRFKEFIERRGSATGGWRGEVEQNDVSGTTDASRDLAGAGTMGSTGSATGLGSDFDTSTGSATGGVSGYQGDYTTGTGSTRTGDTGSGTNNPQDLGTGRRETDSGI
jgi:hypothetical protein